MATVSNKTGKKRRPVKRVADEAKPKRMTADDLIDPLDDEPDGDDEEPEGITSLPARRRRGTSTVNKIQAKEKQRRALEMRKTGMTYQLIADQLGYAGPSGARQAIMAAMEATTVEPAHELRIINYERLNHMILSLWPRVHQGDTSAISTVMSAMRHQEDLVGLQRGVDKLELTQINVGEGGSVISAQVSQDDYIASIQRVLGMTQLHNGVLTGQAALPSADGDDRTDDESGEIIDGDVVAESEPQQEGASGAFSLDVEPED